MYNKRAYNKTKVCFIAVLFYFYCRCADCFRTDHAVQGRADNEMSSQNGSNSVLTAQK